MWCVRMPFLKHHIKTFLIFWQLSNKLVSHSLPHICYQCRVVCKILLYSCLQFSVLIPSEKKTVQNPKVYLQWFLYSCWVIRKLWRMLTNAHKHKHTQACTHKHTDQFHNHVNNKNSGCSLTAGHFFLLFCWKCKLIPLPHLISTAIKCDVQHRSHRVHSFYFVY